VLRIPPIRVPWAPRIAAKVATPTTTPRRVRKVFALFRDAYDSDSVERRNLNDSPLVVPHEATVP
jgi:hypothetical protein